MRSRLNQIPYRELKSFVNTLKRDDEGSSEKEAVLSYLETVLKPSRGCSWLSLLAHLREPTLCPASGHALGENSDIWQHRIKPDRSYLYFIQNHVHWVYVSWGVAFSDVGRFFHQGDSLCLRIVCDEANEHDPIFFDLVIDDFYGGRYVALPFKNANYWINLMVCHQGSFYLLRRSSCIYATASVSNFLQNVEHSSHRALWKNFLQDLDSRLLSEEQDLQVI